MLVSNRFGCFSEDHRCGSSGFTHILHAVQPFYRNFWLPHPAGRVMPIRVYVAYAMCTVYLSAVPLATHTPLRGIRSVFLVIIGDFDVPVGIGIVSDLDAPVEFLQIRPLLPLDVNNPAFGRQTIIPSDRRQQRPLPFAVRRRLKRPFLPPVFVARLTGRRRVASSARILNAHGRRAYYDISSVAAHTIDGCHSAYSQVHP